MDKELLDKLKDLSKKEITLEKLCNMLGLSNLEVLGLIKELEKEGLNISKIAKDDGIHILNKGDVNEFNDNHYKFGTDEYNEFKFAVISDTRLGSTSQQLSILNDIYKKANELGIKHVFHCGNISEGLYPLTSEYAPTLFVSDTIMQANYIVQNYPFVEGIKTYFLLGTKDITHLKKKQIDIGKIISESREDMIYLGIDRCNIEIDKVKLDLRNVKGKKTYTVSYRAQKIIDALRSEDIPDIMIYGGLLQMESFKYRGVRLISSPSVVATTNEMFNNENNNTVGNWFITIVTNKKGELVKVIPTAATYYSTDKLDYQKSKVLRGEQ
ncbi:MAG: hypothetical protein RR708_00555 [Bacilli bacterium]